jgi:hypothetical protein
MPLASAVDLIDVDRYPLDGAGRAAMVREQRIELSASGVCIMPGFLPRPVVTALVDECDGLAPLAHLSDVTGTPYLELPVEGYADDHPRRSLVRSRLGAVGYDLFPADSILRRLYEWDGLMELVGEILGRTPLYRYADPLGALNLAVMGDGDELGWHFDQTDFVVSLAIQASDGGGEFESVQRIRTADDEHYDEVATLLGRGVHERLGRVPMEPGTLMLFEGRHSIHRVTPITGTRPRYVGLLAYDTKPGTVSSDLLRLVRYGRPA